MSDKSSVASSAFAITPSDTVDLSVVPLAVYVGVTGDLKVLTDRGETVTFKGAPAGLVLPLRIRRVFDTDTTATDIVGLR